MEQTLTNPGVDQAGDVVEKLKLHLCIAIVRRTLELRETIAPDARLQNNPRLLNIYTNKFKSGIFALGDIVRERDCRICEM